LLEKKEFEFITIKEICEKAGVNRTTFYLHYESMDDLLIETIEMVTKRFYDTFNNEVLDPETFEILKNEKTIALKMKGVSKAQNKYLTSDLYLRILEDDITCDGENVNLTLKDGSMKRLTIGKTALTGKHTKAVVHPNGCCMPFIKGAKYESV
jgi:AcrR family transcriptional regulator